ncbi:unnamed protein product [Parnassius mnemosyne]|uniref:Uncharacterized protein n=1 Tax=Parnassius mnemosyne TaxID=213953 RepID=A0AAV1M577_9NEOP
MYRNSNSIVRTTVGDTTPFTITVGVHQGSVLSPYLFSVILDELSASVQKLPQSWLLMYADDIALVDGDKGRLTRRVHAWREALENGGLKLNVAKTEYMACNSTDLTSLRIGDDTFERTDNLSRDSANRWRIRVGSSYANSGGTVFTTARIISHPSYNEFSYDHDVAVMHSSRGFSFSNSVRAASIAGSNYNVADNQALWAVGWGTASYGGSFSEQLRRIEVRSINLRTCQNIYVELAMYLTDNMMCSGWLNSSGKDCQGTTGGPLIHNNVIVGVCTWGEQCGLARYPGISTRVSRYTSWIQSNA